MSEFRIVLAGCGSMANEWVKYALSREDAKIVGLMDINPASAESMAERYKIKAGIFTGLEKAIKETGANLVFDVTVPDAHMKTVTNALRLGCDVLGEKPMASSMDEAKLMVRTATETGRTYAVMQNRRYLKKCREFKELISSGTIGKPGFICADFFIGAHFGGFRDIMESPLILDMAIHTFDQARFYTDGDPVSVYCQEFNPEGSWYKCDASAACIFEFSDGSVFCYRGSWCAEGGNTPWEAAWRITGSKGSALWDGLGVPYCEITLPSEENKFIRDVTRIEAKSAWNGREGHFGCLDEMFSALSEGRKPETGCSDNIKSVAMVFGALKSSREGRKIILEY